MYLGDSVCDWEHRVDCGDRPICDINNENCHGGSKTTPEPSITTTQKPPKPQNPMQCIYLFSKALTKDRCLIIIRLFILNKILWVQIAAILARMQTIRMTCVVTNEARRAIKSWNKTRLSSFHRVSENLL